MEGAKITIELRCGILLFLLLVENIFASPLTRPSGGNSHFSVEHFRKCMKLNSRLLKKDDFKIKKRILRIHNFSFYDLSNI